MSSSLCIKYTICNSYSIVLFIRNKHKLTTLQWILVLIVVLILIGLQSIYFGAQERYYGKLDLCPSLAWLGSFVKTKEQAKRFLSVIRFFGCGTFIITIIIFTVWIEYKK